MRCRCCSALQLLARSPTLELVLYPLVVQVVWERRDQLFRQAQICVDVEESDGLGASGGVNPECAD